MVGYEPRDGIVVERRVATGNVFTASDLHFAAEECGTAQPLSYYEALVQKFENVDPEFTTFIPTGDYQNPTSWYVLAVPNVPGYRTMEEFRADFDVCAAGGVYPLRISSSTLLFAPSCGSGYGDGTEREIGCELARDAMEPTLTLK